MSWQTVKRIVAVAAWGLFLSSGILVSADEVARIDLSGEWCVRLDFEDRGEAEAWAAGGFADRIPLPSSLARAGYGQPPTLQTEWVGSIRQDIWNRPCYAAYRTADNFKMPFWLQPVRKYTGAAWYSRQVVVPANWAGKRVALRLERVHWVSSVWVDGKPTGSRDSLTTPHEYDLTSQLTPGNHTLTVRVDNRVKLDVGQNAHSVSDHTQTNWNGIVGTIELTATDRVWIADVQVDPDIEHKLARVKLTLGNLTGSGGRGTLTLDAKRRNTDVAYDPPVQNVELEFGPDTSWVGEFEYALGDDAQTWNEFHPALYDITLALDAKTGEQPHHDGTVVTFGLREIRTDGRRFLMNGQPVMFRGTLECCIFPLTGYPPTDVASWKRIIGICQAHGLNHLRFHSHCPPEAAFQAADELGFYYQVEGPFWCGVGVDAEVDRYIDEEHARIRRAYGNHPSFVLLAYGNEPNGPGRGGVFLAPWVEQQKSVDDRHLVTAASGWPRIRESQYHVTHEPLRLHGWFNATQPSTAFDYRETVQNYDAPVISHESGQWCVFPDMQEIAKYTGVVRANNFEIVRDFLGEHGLLPQAHDFLIASGKFQALCYKHEIEGFLRTRNIGGYQLLDLHDFPGQGTALVGVLDPFWDSKGYVTAAEHRRYSGPVVPLARMEKFVWTTDETFVAQIDVSQFGAADLVNARVVWTLTNLAGERIASGDFGGKRLPRGDLTHVGQLEVPLTSIAKATSLKLEVTIAETEYANDWTVWIYPAAVDIETPGDVLLADSLDAEAIARLSAGEKVLLAIPPPRVAGDTHGDFAPIFWNRLWFPNQREHTLGILCDPQHAALGEFPTFRHSHWQWWDLCQRSKPMILDNLPDGVTPIVQPIDDWNTCRKLATVFEAKVNGGRLLVCSIDLQTEMDRRPAARQLLHSLLRYAAGNKFQPATPVELADIQRLFQAPGPPEQLGQTIKADGQHVADAAAEFNILAVEKRVP